MAEIKVNVELGALDTLSKLLGVFDENLNIISRETGVTAYVEGTKITLSGEENRVLLAETVINKLAGIIRSGEPIDKTRIIYCVELAKEGNAEGIEKVMSGVIAITSRGKQIKCKTVGQKKSSAPHIGERGDFDDTPFHQFYVIIHAEHFLKSVV